MYLQTMENIVIHSKTCTFSDYSGKSLVCSFQNEQRSRKKWKQSRVFIPKCASSMNKVERFTFVHSRTVPCSVWINIYFSLVMFLVSPNLLQQFSLLIPNQYRTCLSLFLAPYLSWQYSLMLLPHFC